MTPDTSGWSPAERALLTELLAGRAVVVSMRKGVHPNVIRWAKQAGLFVRVDRTTAWGNSHRMPRDGDRDHVCDKHEHDLLAGTLVDEHGTPMLHRVGELRGKALGCWCAPARCHADLLAAIANHPVTRRPKHVSRPLRATLTPHSAPPR